MSTGIFSAVLLLFAVLLEYTVISSLPSPWREIALPLLFGIVIMYRVSLFLGVFFLIMAGVLSFTRGLSGVDVFLAYLVAAFSAVLLSNRVFARRSLIALFGFAFGTTSIFYFTTFIYGVTSDLVRAEPLSGTPVLYLFFAVLATVMGVVAVSLIFTNLEGNFGRRFMQKDHSYEIQSRS